MSEKIPTAIGETRPHRATRLRIEAPLVYRSTSDESWATGSTVDISRSGVLFVPTDQSLPDPELDMVILLSGSTLEAAGLPVAAPDLFYGGPVVRATQTADGRKAWAIRFDYEWSGAPSAQFWDLAADRRIPRH